MAHIHVFRCDACGEKMKGRERAQLAILMPEERAKIERTTPKSLAEAMGLTAGAQAHPEEFDLCVTCALALIVTLKERQKNLAAGEPPCLPM
jgi:hypothetical protein